MRFGWEDFEDQLEFLMDDFERTYPRKYREFFIQCGFLLPKTCVVIPIPKTKSKKKKKEILRALLDDWIEQNITRRT